MTIRVKKTTFRALVLILAYALLGPVWYAKTAGRDGAVIEYKRIGVFKWMEIERYRFSQQPGVTFGGASIQKTGLATTAVCYLLLFGVAFRVEAKWKAQKT
jgi:predicted membrane protein